MHSPSWPPHSASTVWETKHIQTKQKHGINCYDWSTMGSGDGWFGQSALIYFCFMREIAIAQWDFIILECTQHFDIRGLEPLAVWYTYADFCFSPTLLGFPCSRVRKYMMLIHKARYKFIQQATDFGHYKLFEMVFGRSVVMKGIDLCRAPAEDLQKRKDELATERRMPLVRASGLPWSWYQVLSASTRRMIRAHEKTVGYKGRAFLCDTRQHAEYIGPTVHVPALLRNSLLWNMKDRRVILPLEWLEVMGLQMFGINNCGASEHLRLADSKSVTSMVGNGMHTASVGTIFMYLLSVIEPAFPVQPGTPTDPADHVVLVDEEL